jgi:non-specific serine/threonine protein kinase
MPVAAVSDTDGIFALLVRCCRQTELMLVFHVSPGDGNQLCLWAEDSTLPPQHQPQPGRPPTVPDPRNHPFAASVGTLHEAVADLPVPIDSETVEETTLTLLFPSGRFGPEPSPKVIRDEEMDAPVDRASPWTVPALTVDSSLLSDVCDAIAETGPGVVPGETVRYWQTVVSLADEFVRGGRVIPQLDLREDGGVAVWQALPSMSEDFSRLRKLRESMPPLARASVTDDVAEHAMEVNSWGGADLQSAREILVTMLDACVDAIVRRRLSNVNPGNPAQDDIHEQWLAALTRMDGTIDADPSALRSLDEHLTEWTHSVETAGEQGVRLCFRLYAPEPETQTDADSPSDDIEAVSPDGWTLELLLQAADDPSLLVEASTVWKSTEATQEVLERHLDRPQETLLEELGRAASLYPAFERTLEETTPATLELSASEADEFLREHAKILEQAGFGVILPAWWNEPERRLGARLTSESESSSSVDSSVGGIGVEQLCDVRWDVILGEERLSRADLEELAALKVPLVRVHGEWVSLQDGDVEAALELYEQTEDGTMTVAEALQADTGLAESDPGVPVVDNQFTGTLSDLFDADLEAWVDDADTPTGFDGQLRPYQKRGLGWMSYLEELGFGGCLADDMGLGKTIQVLARLVAERTDGQSPGPTMVVCPLSVVGNWKHETHDFAPELDVYVHHGADRESGDALVETIDSHDVTVTTYGVVRNDIDTLQNITFHRVVLDEAQKIKNTDAKRTQAIRAVSAHHRFALTGTPVENRLSELWSIMEFCNPGLLGSQTAFREEFSRPIERYGDEQKTEQLRRLIRPFILRRSKTDETIIDDLPEKIEVKEYCNLTEEQATLYKAATDELLGEVAAASDIDRRGKVLQLITALKAICNHPRQYHEDGSELAGRSGKLDRLRDLATEILASDDRALIFTQYTSMAELIRQYFQEELGQRVLYLHGGTPQERRDEMVDQFQSPDGPAFFLLSLRAGGTGLTLTAANHVIHYDRWWNPAVEDQATDRTYRIGQTDDVQVHKLICEGTVEEAVDQMIEQKQDLADSVLAEGEDWLTELSDAELEDLVTLSEETLT